MHPLVRRLADDAHEADAQQALEAFGGDVLGTLYDHLIDEALPLAARRRLPPVFAAHPSRFGLVLLVRSLRRVPVPVRHAAVRALSKIHEADDFSFDPAPVDTAIDRDLRHYAALGQILRLCRLGKTGALPLPPARVQSFREEALERVFRLLGLRYDQRDIYDAYLGITSADPSLRDSAVEFVDNLVDYTTRRVLLPLLDDPEGEQALSIGQKDFDLHLRGPRAALPRGRRRPPARRPPRGRRLGATGGRRRAHGARRGLSQGRRVGPRERHRRARARSRSAGAPTVTWRPDAGHTGARWPVYTGSRCASSCRGRPR